MTANIKTDSAVRIVRYGIVMGKRMTPELKNSCKLTHVHKHTQAGWICYS